MKKILTLSCMFAISIIAGLILLTGCQSDTTSKINYLERTVSSLKNTVKSAATFNQAHLSMPDSLKNIVTNTDYSTGNNQIYVQNFEQANASSMNTTNQRYLARQRATGNNYVADNNLPTTRTSTSYYTPRYTTVKTTTSNNFTEKMSDLYTICDDTCTANTIFESLKNDIIGKCDDCSNILKTIKGLNLTKDQATAITEYCNVLSQSINNINRNCCDSCVSETASINNLKNNLMNNTDKLTVKYLKVLNNVDNNISVLKQAKANLDQIIAYLNCLNGNCNNNIVKEDIVDNTQKTTDNTVENNILQDNILEDKTITNNDIVSPETSIVPIPYNNNTNTTDTLIKETSNETLLDSEPTPGQLELERRNQEAVKKANDALITPPPTPKPLVIPTPRPAPYMERKTFNNEENTTFKNRQTKPVADDNNIENNTLENNNVTKTNNQKTTY